MRPRLLPDEVGGVVRASYREIYGRPMSFRKLTEHLWSLPKIAALLSLAKLGTCIEVAAHDRVSRGKQLIDGLPTRGLALSYDQRYGQRDDVAPFDELQILNVQRIILANPETDTAGIIDLAAEQVDLLVRCLLATNDWVRPEPVVGLGRNRWSA